jgi:oligoendopeptidase F
LAAVDAFEHWVYTHPSHSHEERREAWTKQYDRFGGYWDYQQMPLLFTNPLHSIGYVTSEIGALQVWQNYSKDPQKTMKKYRHALSLGSSKPVPELYKAMGIQFDPRGDLLPGLMAAVEKELARPVEKTTAAQMVPRLDFQRSTGRKTSGLTSQHHLTKS